MYLPPFLARNAHAVEAQQALAVVRRRWNRLFGEEQRWVAANGAGFADLSE